MRLCFIRHGETDWNAGKRIQGQLDVPLSAIGPALAAWREQGLAIDVRMLLLLGQDILKG